MKSRRSVASSALNSGSLRQWFHAASSSLCATISVSGMKRPPKTDSPKFHLSACFFCAASCSSLFCAFANAAFCPTAASGPPLSSRTRDPAAAMPPAPISCTIFEPTTQPSAKAPNSSTCARFVIPKPTTMGRSVRLAPSFSAASRIDSTTALHSASRSALAAAASWSRAPVTPRSETTYTIPGIGLSAASAACAIRSGPEVGAARGTRDRLCRAAAGDMMRHDSSTGRSTMMKPSTPAAAASAHVSSTPAARNEL
mmetsp:Transcript_30542/g.97469  ORF Transcript_30542/g.97469 Transcript_30542/m.97469 type:complete len:256 (-) Transcript_30542:385-1152(-)